MVNFNNPSKLWPEIDLLDEKDLLLLRLQIDGRLSASSLVDLDLDKELVMQFLTVKALMSDLIDDDEVKDNHKVSAVKVCADILAQMTKAQTDIFNAERVKKLEQALVEVLGAVDAELKRKFFLRYEKFLHNL